MDDRSSPDSRTRLDPIRRLVDAGLLPEALQNLGDGGSPIPLGEVADFDGSDTSGRPNHATPALTPGEKFKLGDCRVVHRPTVSLSAADQDGQSRALRPVPRFSDGVRLGALPQLELVAMLQALAPAVTAAIAALWIAVVVETVKYGPLSRAPGSVRV